MSLTGFISYKRVGWTGQTPWNPTNLNIMDKGIKDNNDMIANLRGEVSALNNNFYMETDGIITGNESINLDSALFVDRKKLYIHPVICPNVSKMPIEGFPKNVYAYGVLITYIGNANIYNCTQIYIPHCDYTNVWGDRDKIFVRTLGDTNNNANCWKAIATQKYEAY